MRPAWRCLRLPAALAACILLAALAHAVDVGDTYDKVVAEKGQPRSLIDAGSMKVLTYPDMTVKLKDGVVVSVKTAPPAPKAAPTRAPGQPPTQQEQVAVVKKRLKDALTEVNLIVNQPPPSVPITPLLKGVVSYGEIWFHPGAATPDFKTVDIRKTQELGNYSRFAYVTSNMNPGVAFPGDQLEFNSMTKIFYIDRSIPKKKLTEEEMLEINRLYRIIGTCQDQLTLMGAQP
jgi:hypothetical protein